MTERRALLADRHFDVLVVGGGINGIAIARECALAGRRVLVVDQNDFGSGTTSRSTRIIHGGLRYLEYGEIGLVRESLRERDRLLQQSPHLVRPLRFLLALDARQTSITRAGMAVRTGLWLYHRWAGRPWLTRTTPTELERQLEAHLEAGGQWAVYHYEDAQCEFPERLVAEWLVEAMEAGAVAHNYTQLLQIQVRNGCATGARLRDSLSGAEFEVTAGQIVNASGPWVDKVTAASGLSSERMIGGVKGSHLVLPRFAGAPTQAIFAEAADGRMIFVIPWNEQVLVGTTEVEDSADPGDAQPTNEEIDYLLAGFLRFFPRSGITRADVRYAFSGVRPLPLSPGRKASAVTRRHIIYDHMPDGAAGLFSIIGGKLTTAAGLAREAVRKLGIPVPEPDALTGIVPAEGVEETCRQWAHLAAGKSGITAAGAEAIAEWHGRHAMSIATAAARDEALRVPLCSHTSHIVAEAMGAFAHECAVTLADVLLRRVPVALGPCWSESCTQEAAQAIGRAAGWSQTEIGWQTEKFEEERARFLHPQGRR